MFLEIRKPRKGLVAELALIGRVLRCPQGEGALSVGISGGRG